MMHTDPLRAAARAPPTRIPVGVLPTPPLGLATNKLPALVRPALRAANGVGLYVAAHHLAAAGDNPDRIIPSLRFGALGGGCTGSRLFRSPKPLPAFPRWRPSSQRGASPHRSHPETPPGPTNQCCPAGFYPRKGQKRPSRLQFGQHLHMLQVEKKPTERIGSMESGEAQSRLSTLPARPPRVFSRQDIILIAVTPVLAYGSGIVGGLGSIAGPILAVVAGFLAMTIYATRSGRTNEPVIPGYMFSVSVSAGVFVIVNSFGLWRNSPIESVWVLVGVPLVNALVFGVFLALLFRRRRA